MRSVVIYAKHHAFPECAAAPDQMPYVHTVSRSIIQSVILQQFLKRLRKYDSIIPCLSAISYYNFEIPQEFNGTRTTPSHLEIKFYYYLRTYLR